MTPASSNPSVRLLQWLLLSLVVLSSACSRQPPRYTGELDRTTPWDPALVQALGETPVQNDGRVQPLATLAAFTLYAVHGRRDVQFVAADGQGGDRVVKLSPTEWVLDLWSYPRQSAHYPMFRIENVRVLEQLGFSHDGQTPNFEFLTYAQVMDKVDTLQRLARDYQKKPERLRDAVEGQIVLLWRQLLAYHNLHKNFEELQHDVAVEGEALRSLFDGHERVDLAEILNKAAAFNDFVSKAGAGAEDRSRGNLAQLRSFLEAVVRTDGGPGFLPPTTGQDDRSLEWLTVSQVTGKALAGKADPAHVAMVGKLRAAMMGADLDAKAKGWREYHEAVTAVSRDRADASRVATEAYYYRANWHFHGMMTFLAAFLVAVVCWAFPKSRLLWWGSMLMSIGGLGMLIADSWVRCLVTGHPPITRLYDTFIFIGGVSTLTLVIAEFVVPRRIALALAPFLGCLLVFFGRLFEVIDGQDTMRPLQAVLLSNFWLAVHVPTINIGYAAGLAGGIVAMVWILMRALRIDVPDSTLMKSMVRMAYGVVCFSLATSVVGTILGGVWANDSWGRFWGWDPKENGALLICLAQIALLHARMTGMVRDAGFMLVTAATGMIVLFSWFHVNLLQVGLHAYGFSPALNNAVWTGYCVHAGIVGIGLFDVLLRPNPVAAIAGEHGLSAALPQS
ncbi:MAG: cytochrome c biogenesis protein CcsA [Planctomycetes bacterium]|nr:cytochrome c biogenesis protein CcsA [Planctomycetota bacterium]